MTSPAFPRLSKLLRSRGEWVGRTPKSPPCSGTGSTREEPPTPETDPASEELVAQLHAIDNAFRGLRSQKRTAVLLKTSGSIATAASASTEEEAVGRKRRKRRRLTLAEKKFISERMKKYWAARKKKEA